MAHWKRLYLLGGIAPLATIAIYMVELIFTPWEGYPETVVDWYALFERSPFLGLFCLHSLDMLSISLLGIMFLALCAAYWETDRVLMAIGTPFGFVGITVFVVPRTALMSVATLSQQYAAATTPAEKAQLVAAGRAISSLGAPTVSTAGFFIVAFAALVIAFAMYKAGGLSRVAAVVAMVGFAVTACNDAAWILFPSLATPLLVATGLVWMGWWGLVGVVLLKRWRSRA